MGEDDLVKAGWRRIYVGFALRWHHPFHSKPVTFREAVRLEKADRTRKALADGGMG